MHGKKLIFLDEIQRRPDLFPILRSFLDENGRNGQLVILGSISKDLIRQSSETLAGRIAYTELTPFLFSEIDSGGKSLMKNWLRGGFPRSFLARNDESSFLWRENFARTFLERDIPQLGFNISKENLSRLWRMCAHSHGQLINYSKLGASLGMSHTTMRSYIDLLCQAFMVRLLLPFSLNTKERIVKSPKIYIRDSGILHNLLDIETFDDLLGHPIYGYSFEGFVIENIMAEFPSWEFSFYRTSTGSEIDLIMTKGTRKIAVEIKASKAPEVTKGFWNALKDLEIDEAYIIALVDEDYHIAKNVKVTSLRNFSTQFAF